MRRVLAALFVLALIGAASSVDAASAKKKHGQHEQRGWAGQKIQGGGPIRDIDETRYYQRLSEKIPFGSGTWWRQRQLENPAP